jgi:hypothetical protein
MILAAALIHPFSLRFLGNRFHYQDRITSADIIFVPRFVEDKAGEVYTDAFRQFWEGNGRSIWVEDDFVFGFTMKDIVIRMAQQRGIKASAIHSVGLSGDDSAKASQGREVFAKQGIRRVVLVVPEYASRRYHSLYSSEGSGAGDSIVFLVKPVDVPYFRSDKWWRNNESRSIMMREICRLGSMTLSHIGFGSKGDNRKE